VTTGLINDLRELGRRYRLGPRWRFIRRRFWRRWDELIFAFDINQRRAATARVPVTFEVLTDERLQGGQEIPELELLPRHEILARLRRGHFCVLALMDGKIVQYCWVGVGVWNLEDIGVSASLTPDEGFIYDMYATQDARGNRIFFALLAHLIEELVRRGFKIVYTRIRRRNVAALVATKFFGFAERLEINSMRILSCMRIYDAVLVRGSGYALSLLTAERTRMGAGVLVWRAGERTGYRINLPTGYTISPKAWVPAPNGKP
jgi:GNAT superfamily N-acetyltransferase